MFESRRAQLFKFFFTCPNFLCRGFFFIQTRINTKKKRSSLGGLEPPTFRLTAERANRLRHRDLIFGGNTAVIFIPSCASKISFGNSQCIINEVAWPSGLRRWFKAPVSSEAWVRIPPLPFLLALTSQMEKYSCFLYTQQHRWRSGQVVRRRSRKPKITGSNPVCAFF